jgi:hypothetical protein
LAKEKRLKINSSLPIMIYKMSVTVDDGDRQKNLLAAAKNVVNAAENGTEDYDSLFDECGKQTKSL